MHIPFFAPRKPASAAKLAASERKLRSVRNTASSAVGFIIKIGSHITSRQIQSRIQRQFLPLVNKHLDGVHFRVQKFYSLALATAELVS